MSSLVLTVTAEKSQTDLQQLYQSSDSRVVAKSLSQLFDSAASGLSNVNVSVQTGSASPVAASGTVTLVYATVVADDTVTVGSVTLTCKTDVPANENQFRKQTDLATTATNLATAINAHSVLGKIVKASAAAGVVTIAALQKGLVGNQIALAKSAATPAGITVSGAYLASGAGGATDTAVVLSLGL